MHCLVFSVLFGQALIFYLKIIDDRGDRTSHPSQVRNHLEVGQGRLRDSVEGHRQKDEISWQLVGVIRSWR